MSEEQTTDIVDVESTPVAETAITSQMQNTSWISPREIYDDLDKAKVFALALAQASGEDAKTALAKIIIGAEMGIGAAASVRGIHIIKNKMAMASDLIIALAKDDGWDFEIKHSDPVGQWCWVGASKPGKEPYGFTWTMAMAKTAGLVRTGSGWMNFPWDMLYARAASHVARKVAPGRVHGVYTPEEVSANAAPDARVAPELPNRPKAEAGAHSGLLELADVQQETKKPTPPPDDKPKDDKPKTDEPDLAADRVREMYAYWCEVSGIEKDFPGFVEWAKKKTGADVDLAKPELWTEDMFVICQKELP